MLRQILRDVQSPRDLAHLFHSLGYESEDRPAHCGALAIARWRGFHVLAVASSEPGEATRQLAARLARDSRRAIAVALSPDRTLSLAAPLLGQPGVTRVLRLHLENPTPFALQQLEKLRPKPTANALTHALAVADVLSSEQVGERFFSSFRRIVDRMAASLDARQQVNDRRLAALLSLTRVLFLYFVQEKGWLDGDGSYLHHLFETAIADGRHFHRAALVPLFFGTLNRPIQERNQVTPLGQIPYLNGGLFQLHPVETRLGPIAFSNDEWRDAFDNLFERFRFCVREANEVDAIAPDMLGRVFERMMDSAARHESGSFYTPETVVRQIVEATIETALAPQLPAPVLKRLVAREPIPAAHRERAAEALRQMRILDPAVGSGAFLLGALEIITEMRCRLDGNSDPATRQLVRRQVLGENLTGVDINPIAVRLAELRLWLALVAEDSTVDISRVAPLPNLDGVVRQGDTLLDPLSAVRRFSPGSTRVWNEVARAVRSAHDSLFDARGPAKSRVLSRLRQAEISLARRLLAAATAQVKHRLTDLAAAAGARDLFGKRTGLTPAQRALRRKLRSLETDLTHLARRVDEGELPFFSFEVHAPDVMARGGFSAVVGNPPWIRAERLPRSLRRTLTERFTWWRAQGTQGFAHLPDLSVAFLERSLELTAPGGAVGFLLPSKVTTAAYGEATRRGLVRDTRIRYVHRIPAKEAARFKATTYPIGIVASKTPPEPDQVVNLDFKGGSSVAQRALSKPGPWILLPDPIHEALDELRGSGARLSEVAAPALGVKTGADAVFVGRVVRRLGHTAIVRFQDQEVAIECDALRPVLRGRDIRPFRPVPERVIVWLHDPDGEPRALIPPHAQRYIESHRHALGKRADYTGGPLWAVFRVKRALSQNRVVWSDMMRRPRVVALDETPARSAVPLNTCYIAAAPDRVTALAIVAVMNSSWIAALISATGDEARGGYRRLNARSAGEIPIPQSRLDRIALSELSLEAHCRNVSQHSIDEAVADALGLSERTRRALSSLAANHR